MTRLISPRCAGRRTMARARAQARGLVSPLRTLRTGAQLRAAHAAHWLRTACARLRTLRISFLRTNLRKPPSCAVCVIAMNVSQERAGATNDRRPRTVHSLR